MNEKYLRELIREHVRSIIEAKDYVPRYRLEYTDQQGRHNKTWACASCGRPNENNVRNWVQNYVNGVKENDGLCNQKQISYKPEGLPNVVNANIYDQLNQENLVNVDFNFTERTTAKYIKS